MKKLLLAVFLLTLSSFGKEVSYEVFYGWFSAGKIKIEFLPDKVIVKGKSGGFIGIFYHYKLHMVYDFANETASYMVEEEGSKRKNYDFNKILQKKAWLPMVIRLLSEAENPPEHLKVGQYTVKLLRKEKSDYLYSVEGSKRVKKILLKGWETGHFPREIEIETTKGNLTLKRES